MWIIEVYRGPNSVPRTTEMWYSGIEVDEPGEWIYFRPGGEEDDEDVGNV